MIEDLPSPSIVTNDNELLPTDPLDQPLIPGLSLEISQPDPEPDYNAMDNLTLLSTLNIQDNQSSHSTTDLFPNLQ